MSEKMGLDLTTYMKERRERVDAALEEYLPPEGTHPESLHGAMRYSVFSGGKRFRPVLCMAAFEACGGEGDRILPVACATELVHTYSLIHDDLPCMDDDDMRRGRPTNHKVYGEAVAMLAGDALLTLAMELIVHRAAELMGAETALAVAADLVEAIGSQGMVAGQVVDMEYENRDVDEPTVTYIHDRKTAYLITSAVRCGAIVAGAEEGTLERLSAYGRALGRAFQIMDDLLDEQGGFGTLKSGRGLDRGKGKATFPKVRGIEGSKSAAFELVGSAKTSLSGLGDEFSPLLALADFVATRSF